MMAQVKTKKPAKKKSAKRGAQPKKSSRQAKKAISWTSIEDPRTARLYRDITVLKKRIDTSWDKFLLPQSSFFARSKRETAFKRIQADQKKLFELLVKLDGVYDDIRAGF